MFWFPRTPARAGIGGFVAVLAILGFFPIATPAQAESTLSAPLIYHDPWIGGAYKDQWGRLENCTVVLKADDGVAFFVRLQGDGTYAIGLRREGWELGNLRSYDVQLRIDRLAERTAFGLGDGTAILIELGNDEEFFDALGRGRTLYIRGDHGTLPIPLSGSRVALQELTDCVWQNTVAARDSNPSGDLGRLVDPYRSGASGQPLDDLGRLIDPYQSGTRGRPLDDLGRLVDPYQSGTSGQPLGDLGRLIDPYRSGPYSQPFGDLGRLVDPFQSGADGQAAVDGRGSPLTEARLRGLLVRSGVTAPLILPAEIHDDDVLPYTTQLWIASLVPTVVGVSIYVPMQVSAQQGMQVIAGRVGKACHGRTAIAVDDTVQGPSYAIGRAAIDCLKVNGRSEFHVTGLFADTDTVFLMHLSTKPGDKTAHRINDNIQSVVYQGID